jgi:hypothetical protein
MTVSVTVDSITLGDSPLVTVDGEIVPAVGGAGGGLGGGEPRSHGAGGEPSASGGGGEPSATGSSGEPR